MTTQRATPLHKHASNPHPPQLVNKLNDFGVVIVPTVNYLKGNRRIAMLLENFDIVFPSISFKRVL